jgi:hypothetical protein
VQRPVLRVNEPKRRVRANPAKNHYSGQESWGKVWGGGLSYIRKRGGGCRYARGMHSLRRVEGKGIGGKGRGGTMW